VVLLSRTSFKAFVFSLTHQFFMTAIIQRQTRTRVSVSSRDEFVPGTRDRIVTIVGSPADCRAAEIMLGDKLPKL
jgi:hypothetical protein